VIDLVRFGLVTGLLALAGAGVTACLRVPFDLETRLLMGPAFGQSLWAIALGTGVRLGWPVKEFGNWLWAATLVLAVVGVWQLWRDHLSAADRRRFSWIVIVVAWVAPVLVMGPFFWHGLADYPGSGLPDGWSYVAYGQYLWDFPSGSEGGLAPLYQFAWTLVSTRNVTGGQLGLLALLRHPGEVQAGMGLLQAVALAAYAAAVGAFCRRAGFGRTTAATVIVVTVLSGWILNVLWANNLDNLLALAAAPALAVLVAWPRPDKTSWCLGGAWLGAGLLHTYPDLGVAVLGLAAVCTVAVIATTRQVPTRKWIVPALAAVTLLLALMPGYQNLVALLRTHADVATLLGAPRPGEGMFLGLIAPRHALAGWWALGSEHGYERLLVIRTVIAGALFALLLAGAWAVLRERQTAWLIWLGLPLGLAPFLAVVQGYAYGAYKAILMGWWFETFLVVRGGLALAKIRVPKPYVALVWLTVAALPAVASARLLVAPVSRTFRMPRPSSMAVFRQVHEIDTVVGADPVLVAVRDEEAEEWAVYHLRHLTTALFTNHRYLVPKAGALARAQSVDLDRVRWVLTDAPGSAAAFMPEASSRWTLRWRGGPYALWETPPGAGRSLAGGFALAR
jgi:hypothetical protein